MNRPENSHSDDDYLGPDVTIVDESELIPATLTPAQILASWREDRKYMEKLKKYRPEEYEAIMKEREARAIKPPPELDQPS